MSRIKLELPKTFSFTATIPVRITDINYGGHAGNDTILSLIHEARMQFLTSMGYSELSFGGVGLIMADVCIEFKSEVFYGDTITASVAISDFTKIGFDVYYKLEKAGNEKSLVAKAKTGMLCYDYTRKKLASVPDEAIKKITG